MPVLQDLPIKAPRGQSEKPRYTIKEPVRKKMADSSTSPMGHQGLEKVMSQKNSVRHSKQTKEKMMSSEHPPEHYASHPDMININVPGTTIGSLKENSVNENAQASAEMIEARKIAFADEEKRSLEAMRKSKHSEFTKSPVRCRPIKPRNLFNMDTDYFRKLDDDPALFNVEIDKEIFEHLNDNNLNAISKNEVVYKVLKEQLRQQ